MSYRRNLEVLSAIAVAVAAAALLGACAGKRGPQMPQPLTLKSLADRKVDVGPDAGIPANADRTIAAYRDFLAAAPKASQRPEAMRRLGDLEMDSADNKAAAADSSTGVPDYRAAIARYEEFLKSYPKDPGNHRVLYQLARAHEQDGKLEVALATLDRLVAAYPQTAYSAEAHFRRGELLFATRDYAKAERAYSTVLASSSEHPYRDRALYMQGWSIFKQGRLEDSLASFFGVLDTKSAALSHSGPIDALKDLSRADRELVEDTFRVTSLALANLQGAASIAPLIGSDGSDGSAGSNTRRAYEFRVYHQLGELYLKQERVKDAADTLALFARQYPMHAQAPQMQARVIDIYQHNGFANLALQAKQDYVVQYGVASDFRRANAAGWDAAQPLVKAHLTELARHHHANAQKTRASADYDEAIRWYRLYLASYPQDPGAAQNQFLLAELLFEDGRFALAATEYQKAAYDFPAHTRSADAGYAALLAHAGGEKQAPANDLPATQRASIASALKFADTFGADPRIGLVLANSAEKLFVLKDAEQATVIARRVLALQPAAAVPQQRVAWTVLAHTAFDRAAFGDAEKAYAEVLAVTEAGASGRGELVDRLAASVYKQGEQALAQKQPRDAVAHFSRVATMAPQSAVHANAMFDAASALIGLKDWDAAGRALEDFRLRFTKHALQTEVPPKLALVYLEQQRWAPAAAEFERIAASNPDAEVMRDAQFQAAALHQKAGARAVAVKAWERYVKTYPTPLEPALDARIHLAALARGDGDGKRELAFLTQVFDVERRGGSERNPRTNGFGATAALALAEPAAEVYRKVPLAEPLQRQLKLKKTKFEEALKAYATVGEYGVAATTTAATFHTAALYQDFGRALMQSQRPKKLSKAELEQYNVMLEEQAFPFEEKAIELHETNARRAAEGLFDSSVEKSFKALAELRPVRYGKTERDDASGAAVALNSQGIDLRRKGKFDEARQAYEKAIAADPVAPAPVLNLAILADLYLGDRPRALELYERYQALVSPADVTVAKWLVDLKNRKASPAMLSRKDP